jgi:hypothetical protein
MMEAIVIKTTWEYVSQLDIGLYFGTPTTVASSQFRVISSQINNTRLMRLGVRATL